MNDIKFKRGKHSCPVCGKTHRYHCSVAEDGSLALCKYTPSERQARDGRYIHRLTETPFPPPQPRAEALPRETVRADRFARTHAVYTAMLESLTLTPAHAGKLLNERGLSDVTIAGNLYASTPDFHQARGVAAALVRQGFDVSGVAGFYRDRAERWTLNTYHKGFYVPCRDVQGRIAGCQIRLDCPLADGTKYVWLSSNGKPEGVTSGAPVHFVKPDLAVRTRRAIVTEGLLKADIIADVRDCAVIAFAGADTFPSDIGERLRAWLPTLAEVAIFYDTDFSTKPEVMRALRRLKLTLKASGLRVRPVLWDATGGKGFDDYLLREREQMRAAERRAA